MYLSFTLPEISFGFFFISLHGNIKINGLVYTHKRPGLYYSLSLPLSLSLSPPPSLSPSHSLLRTSAGAGAMHALCFLVCVQAFVHLMLIFVRGGSTGTGALMRDTCPCQEFELPSTWIKEVPKKGYLEVHYHTDHISDETLKSRSRRGDNFDVRLKWFKRTLCYTDGTSICP